MRTALVLALVLLAGGQTEAQQACGEVTVTERGATYKVLFAKNRAVQQYVLVRSTQNTENDHDALVALENKYGPEGVNAPPVRIVTYRDAGGGMRIPLKAIDSCGRISEFK